MIHFVSYIHGGDTKSGCCITARFIGIAMKSEKSNHGTLIDRIIKQKNGTGLLQLQTEKEVPGDALWI